MRTILVLLSLAAMLTAQTPDTTAASQQTQIDSLRTALAVEQAKDSVTIRQTQDNRQRLGVFVVTLMLVGLGLTINAIHSASR